MQKVDYVKDDFDLYMERVLIKTEFENIFYSRKIKKSLMSISNKELLKRIIFEKKGRHTLNNFIPKGNFPVYDIALKLKKDDKGVSFKQRVALINVLSKYYAGQGLKQL